MFVLIFIFFLTAFSAILFLVNAYVFLRLSVLFSQYPLVYPLFKYTFILLAIAFIAGRVWERVNYCPVSTFLINAGSIWLGFLFYAFVLFLVADIVLLLLGVAHIPGASFQSVGRAGLVGLLAVLVCFYGYYHSKKSQVTRLTLNISKSAGQLTNLNIVSMSDLHLGTLIKNSRVRHLVDQVNALHPDIVLLAGDVVDEDLAPVIRYNLAEELARLKAKFGVYAITGNHEYIGGAQSAVDYLSRYNITYLRDKAVLIANSFYLVGREDRSGERFSGIKRQSLSGILSEVDKRYPLILLDHQPVDLQAACDNGIDFQISGHTHHGQMFPASLITRLIFEKSWGYLKKGHTQYYVSCGAGTWGPPLRVGSYSEILNVIINFKHENPTE